MWAYDYYYQGKFVKTFYSTLEIQIELGITCDLLRNVEYLEKIDTKIVKRKRTHSEKIKRSPNRVL